MKKPFVSNWVKAIEYFLWAYLISQIIAIIIRFWSGSDIGHFITMMLLLPSFAFFYIGRYLATVPVKAKENRRLGLLWAGMAILLDFGIYIVIANFPLVRIYLYGLPFLVITYLAVLLVPFLFKRQTQTASQDQPPILDKPGQDS
jgi:hypothetical protein